MEVFIENENNVTTARFVGRLDTPASQEVTKSIEPILTIRKAAAAKGGNVIVKDINNDIRQVFMMTGFLNLFEIQ